MMNRSTTRTAQVSQPSPAQPGPDQANGPVMNIAVCPAALFLCLTFRSVLAVLAGLRSIVLWLQDNQQLHTSMVPNSI